MPNKDILTPFDDYVAASKDGGGSDMRGSGETLEAHGSSSASLSPFDNKTAPKPGMEPTGGRMGKPPQFQSIPEGGTPPIQTSVATNLTGKKKA